MKDISNEINNAVKVFNGELVVGNHDSILFLDSDVQNKLIDCSKIITSLLLKNNHNYDNTISDLASAIDDFLDSVQNDRYRGLFIIPKNNKLKNKYKEILSHLDKASLFLKLQQTQMHKELKMLENLKLTVKECTNSLENCIERAEVIINNYSKSDLPYSESFENINILDNDRGWYERLNRKIENLKILRTVALQSQAQIDILYNNNLMLIDKISNAVSEAFPVWRLQIALALGVELLENNANIQDKVLKMTEKSIKSASPKADKVKKLKKSANVNMKKLLELTMSMRKTLNEIEDMENGDKTIRDNFEKILNREVL